LATTFRIRSRAEVIAGREPATLIRLGLRDVFAESGDAELLFDHFGMGAPHVCEAVSKLVAQKRK
jgi:transketolase